MEKDNTNQLSLGNLEAKLLVYGSIILNKEKFIQVLDETDSLGNLGSLKNKIIALKNIITYYKNDKEGLLNIDSNGDTIYVICTWYNHWTTVLIEEHISTHPKVIPTIKNIKGIDIFFDGQPFDLKITYLPRGYEPIDVVRNSSDLAIWMYENQGAQRFGTDNRLRCFVSSPKFRLRRNFVCAGTVR